MDSPEQCFLSIIVPAYNEETRLPPSLDKIAAFLRQQSYQSEVVVVENGSTDDTTGAVERFVGEHVRAEDPFQVRLLHSTPGKGAAVKTGMLAGKGNYLFICDADLAMPIEEISKFLPTTASLEEYDIAIASREAPGAIRYNEPAYRHVMGRVFNFLVQVLAVSGIQDTQCGFKCFTRQAAQLIFPLQQIDGWGFDVEVLYIARRKNLRMIEVPIHWYFGNDSRIKPVEATINMVLELLKIRRNGRLGRYDTPPSPSTPLEKINSM